MEPYIGQLQLFGFNFAPRGWAFCDGQLLDISQNQALFSLLGTTYGGDGRRTFALPDLRGRAPIHEGQGPGLTARNLGQKGGLENVTLSVSQIPSHNHDVTAANTDADSKDPTSGLLTNQEKIFKTSASRPGNVKMAAQMITPTGGGGPHENMPPYLTLNWCIALTGVYPSRS